MLKRMHHYLNELKRIINTPNYVTNYFKTKDGMNFSKNNPEKAPSTEVIMRMTQRINRS